MNCLHLALPHSYWLEDSYIDSSWKSALTSSLLKLYAYLILINEETATGINIYIDIHEQT